MKVSVGVGMPEQSPAIIAFLLIAEKCLADLQFLKLRALAFR